jgi:hypothetical protein
MIVDLYPELDTQLNALLFGKEGILSKQRRRKNNQHTQAVKSFSDKLKGSLSREQRAEIKAKLETTHCSHRLLKEASLTTAIIDEFMEDTRRCARLLKPLLLLYKDRANQDPANQDPANQDPAKILHNMVDPFADLPLEQRPSPDRYSTRKRVDTTSAKKARRPRRADHATDYGEAGTSPYSSLDSSCSDDDSMDCDISFLQPSLKLDMGIQLSLPVQVPESDMDILLEDLPEIIFPSHELDQDAAASLSQDPLFGSLLDRDCWTPTTFNVFSL